MREEHQIPGCTATATATTTIAGRLPSRRKTKVPTMAKAAHTPTSTQPRTVASCIKRDAPGPLQAKLEAVCARRTSRHIVIFGRQRAMACSMRRRDHLGQARSVLAGCARAVDSCVGSHAPNEVARWYVVDRIDVRFRLPVMPASFASTIAVPDRARASQLMGAFLRIVAHAPIARNSAMEPSTNQSRTHNLRARVWRTCRAGARISWELVESVAHSR